MWENQNGLENQHKKSKNPTLEQLGSKQECKQLSHPYSFMFNQQV